MKNKFLLGAIAMICAASAVFTACKDEQDIDSVIKQSSVPILIEKRMGDTYVYGLGQSTLEADLPSDTIAIVRDSIYGFAGGWGGLTGKDYSAVLRSDVVGGLPDGSEGGSFAIEFEKYNLGPGPYKITVSSTVIVAGPIDDPGPVDLEGTWKRNTAAGYLLVIKKLFDGVYLLTNPGGAASVPANPYLLYNHATVPAGGNTLEFRIQTDLCGGGLQLVGPNATTGLKSSDYSAAFPPELIVGTPLTLKWKVFEFYHPTGSEVHPGMALCNWGLGIRTFEKQ